MKKQIAAKYSTLRHRFIYGPVGSINGNWKTIAYYRNTKNNNYYCIIDYVGKYVKN